MTEKVSPDEALVSAFHLMWDHFPGPCTLVRKPRIIVAANPVGIKLGRLVGMDCSTHGTAESHKGCLAGMLFKTKLPQCQKTSLNGQEFLKCWLPVDGYPDYYIHFGVGVPKDS